MMGIWSYWMASVIAALVTSVAFARVAFGGIDVGGIACGWAIAVASSAVALLLDRRSVGSDSRSFLLYGLLGKGVRFIVVAGLAVGFPLISDGGYVSFATALVIGYLVLMVYEIWTLYVAGLTGMPAGRKKQSDSDGWERKTDGDK